ncbi:EF-hand domain-containing family member C2-like [Macrobrachium rosenbergii]|uniref:EF-hand domain-containing family member C2-like n=1 Tax=Macrobrachium rosenbergii TaxID=79674 RepID=UPI0034D3D325
MGGVTTPVVEKVELRYYLEDDTAEVRVHHLTPHQDALTPAKPQLPTKFLKRGPVAKELSEVNGAGSLGAVGRPTLNLVGLIKGQGAHLKDKWPQALPSPSFLKPSELLLGNAVSVGGRLMRLCDCDSFTTIYYKNVFDIDQVPVGYEYLQKGIGMHQTPRITPLDPRWLEEPPRDPLHPLPTTVTTIVGGYHARDIRDGYEGTILRFGARLVTDKEKDREREFVINFYVFDSTVSVFEVPRLNSGMRAGMFLSRGLVVKGESGECVKGQDLYAGNVITLNSHTFYITHADEFTLNFMEKHADEFPQANYNVALDKARQVLGHHELTDLLRKFTPSDPDKTGFAPTGLVQSALFSALGSLGSSSVNKQHIASLVQRHRQLGAAPPSRQQLTHLAALHLKRKNFDGIPDLMSGLRGRDIEAKGVLPASDLRAAVVATRLPFPTALTDALVESFKREDGMIDYAHFCHELDYRIRPNIHDHIPCQLDEASLEVALRRLEDKVDYINLVADLEGSANSHHFAGSGVV